MSPFLCVVLCDNLTTLLRKEAVAGVVLFSVINILTSLLLRPAEFISVMIMCDGYYRLTVRVG